MASIKVNTGQTALPSQAHVHAAPFLSISSSSELLISRLKHIPCSKKYGAKKVSVDQVDSVRDQADFDTDQVYFLDAITNACLVQYVPFPPTYIYFFFSSRRFNCLRHMRYITA